MAKAQGFCIYCGSAGLTKEHMWADWLRRYIPREMDHHKIQTTVEFANRVEESFTRHNGDAHVRKLRCVCLGCNQGWMGRLQQTAKPFLVPMLTGEPIALHRNGQTAISAWAAMFTMTAEYMDPAKVAIPADERRWLRSHGRPPHHWRIWIGHGRREKYPQFAHRVLPLVKDASEMLPDDAVAPPNTQSTTICLGDHLLIHVLSGAKPARRLIRRWALLPPIAPSMMQVWPIERPRVTWPSNDGTLLDDPAIHALAEHFYNIVYRDRARERGGG